jgi:hypothetical protein
MRLVAHQIEGILDRSEWRSELVGHDRRELAFVIIELLLASSVVQKHQRSQMRATVNAAAFDTEELIAIAPGLAYRAFVAAAARAGVEPELALDVGAQRAWAR